MSTDTRHGCPGGCGKKVDRTRVACHGCWRRLPQDLQDAINRAYAVRRRAPSDLAAAGAHRAALTGAIAWYRDNPAGAVR